MFLKTFFSERLIQLRKQHSISQLALAEIAGVGRTTITMLENGSNLPSAEVLYAVADYFDVSIDYLFGRTDKPEVNR